MRLRMESTPKPTPPLILLLLPFLHRVDRNPDAAGVVEASTTDDCAASLVAPGVGPAVIGGPGQTCRGLEAGAGRGKDEGTIKGACGLDWVGNRDRRI